MGRGSSKPLPRRQEKEQRQRFLYAALNTPTQVVTRVTFLSPTLELAGNGCVPFTLTFLAELPEQVSGRL